ncbi:molybdopterin-dependent oxidoreductase [Caballeronia ptereochthonis]|uniref:Molybdopterin oxidoreductase n=1 Tax=Caballeronia ptereochthonis TaxID=1777144 RepID=A0A158B9F6_9BURK|nr:molybdopterin-dependent oxidoreductase [Caballeronia ptereochthonis]SAK66396.1 molybdopterin oxidoreductase [Caballeronia ptereochthonis]
MEAQEKKGYCTLCRSRCGTVNVVRGGIMAEVRPDRDHPTGHAMCLKGKSAPELVHSPHRVLHPMRRTAPKGADDPGWVRIGWEEALDEIAAKLDALRREHGAETVAFGVTTPSGTPMSDSIDWVERFIWSYGSPNICYATEICNWHKDVAHMFTFGCGMPTADYRNADVILLWGTNPANTWLAQADAIAQARREGARLIVADPRPTALAREADVWLRVRPGTDAALAMGIAREMIATQRFDESFVRAWTNAPLLVRRDDGHFLRERDIDPHALRNRYLIWNAAHDRAEALGEEGDTSPADFALSGLHTIASIDCEPAFACYLRALDAYTPDHVEAITGVAPDELKRAAELLAPGRRIAYHAWSGVGQQANATQTERAIATLYALTGAFDTRGSNREFARQPANAVSTYALLSPQQRAKALGLAERPLGPPAQGWVTARDMYRAIIEGEPYKVRALFAFGTNPLVSQPDSARAHEALSALEFHVHCDLYETPSSRYADIFLPVNTPWEREGLRIGFEIDERAVELVQLRQRMVAPRGESRADYDIVFELATRLGMREAFFGGSIEAGWNHMLAPLGLDVETLRAHPEGIYRPLEQREKQYAMATPDGVRGFRTETLRVELYSEKLLRHGYPPVPVHVPPAGLAPDARDPKYPYVLTSTKNGYYCHSQHRGVTRLRRRAPCPVVEMSASLAKRKGVESDDWVILSTAQGTARFVARIEAALADDVLIAEYGWWQACDELGMKGYPALGEGNSNFSNLVSSEKHDPLSGSMPMRALACDIEPDPLFDRARRAWQGWREFVVAKLEDEAEGVRTVTFTAKDGGALPDYLPGQHVTVHVPTLGARGTTRAYSLVGPASEPARHSYTISVRHQLEGAMSGHIHRALEIGDRVDLRAPGGTFILPMRSRQPVVMFAGGIGITPFIAYLESLARVTSMNRRPEAWLFYANRHGASHAFRGRIGALREAWRGLHVFDCYAHPRMGEDVAGRDYDRAGYLDASSVDDALIRRRARFYLCGPEPMMAAITEGLLARGVPAFDIFKEAFRSPSEPRADETQRFTVEFVRSKKSAQWTPKDGSLLAFAEGLGIALPSGCRVGQCESCAVRVAAGTTGHLSGNAPDEPDMCFACQAIPLSDLVVEA